MFIKSPGAKTIEAMLWLYDFLFWVGTVLFVGIICAVIWMASIKTKAEEEELRRQKAKKTLTKRIIAVITHNNAIEFYWTIAPVILLTIMAYPSFDLLYYYDIVSSPQLTLKAEGNQWYWSYEIPSQAVVEEPIIVRCRKPTGEKHNIYIRKVYEYDYYAIVHEDLEAAEAIAKDIPPGFPVGSEELLEEALLDIRSNEDSFPIINRIVPLFGYRIAEDECDSYMLDVNELEEGEYRLLTPDPTIRLPAGVNLRFVIGASDVLHSFAVPALGIKIDAVPGRINQVPVYVTVPGIYYGQCSELCGVGHGFMPIRLEFIELRRV
jgi:heme/copper-type cytochrome/quinol oxidase subunit 2